LKSVGIYAVYLLVVLRPPGACFGSDLMVLTVFVHSAAARMLIVAVLCRGDRSPGAAVRKGRSTARTSWC